jgi:SnoaL-like domain
MGADDVRRYFRAAVEHDDAGAMGEGLEILFGLRDGSGVSSEAEYELRHPDYVMDMPQSGERIRGRDAMKAMQEAFPGPPSITLRRVIGSGHVWVVEGVNDYGDEVWHAVVILELDDDGRIVKDTRYYTQASAAPEWRAAWVEPLD